jgi:hypothetical protein
MKRIILIVISALSLVLSAYSQDKFPDGTEIPEWFHDYSKVKLNELGKA